MSPPRRTRLVWFGPKPGPLSWLFSRLSRHAEVVACFPQVGAEAFQATTLTNVDRVILACQDRLSYPTAMLQRLTRQFPEVPVALALDSWWDGAGRTGLHTRSHLAIPWHRWWDSWVPWLEGTHTALFSPCPTPHTHLQRTPPQRTHDEGLSVEVSSDPPGLIVADCQRTAQSWKLTAHSLGYPARSMRLAEFYGSFESRLPGSSPTWVLWDDSCLNRFDNASEAEACRAFFAAAQHRFDEATLCGAFHMPRWSVWNAAEASGAHELLVKPNTGDSLGRILDRKTISA